LQALPRQRAWLLPSLLLVQDDLGWLPDWAIEAVGAHLRVPRSEAYGVASSFPELRLHQPAEHVLRVCIGAACRLAGAHSLRASTRDFPGEVETADCLFICGVAPAAELDGHLVGRAGTEQLRV
jgi:NADH-quinone oxidoreductase subunit E